jgi:hypothetical protein
MNRLITTLLTVLILAGAVGALPLHAQLVTEGLSIHYCADNVDGQGRPGDGSTSKVVNLANSGADDGVLVEGKGIIENAGLGHLSKRRQNR